MEESTSWHILFGKKFANTMEKSCQIEKYGDNEMHKMIC